MYQGPQGNLADGIFPLELLHPSPCPSQVVIAYPNAIAQDPESHKIRPMHRRKEVALTWMHDEAQSRQVLFHSEFRGQYCVSTMATW